MLHKARELGMKTMVGCMIESSIGISGAAQLLPLLDFADLDGASLLSHDPAAGVKIVNGKIEKPHLPGTGASLA
jgi:L-Ala-D/L-Glu epimerase